MLSLNRLRAVNRQRQKEWDGEKKFTLLYYSNALAGEVGEVANVAKKMERERLGLVGSKATLEDLADELADVIIYADLLANEAGLDLAQAVIDKFNKTSDKYGLKTRLTPGLESPKEQS